MIQNNFFAQLYNTVFGGEKKKIFFCHGRCRAHLGLIRTGISSSCAFWDLGNESILFLA